MALVVADPRVSTPRCNAETPIRWTMLARGLPANIVADRGVEGYGARRVEYPSVKPPLQRGDSDPLDDVGAWLTRFSAVGRDDDHTVHALGAVDRRGRCTPQDVDRRDVVRVEIREPVDRVVLLLAVV